VVTRPALPTLLTAVVCAVGVCVTPADAAQSSPDAALPTNASGQQIFVAACATCHGMDGKGSPPATVGFDLPLPNGHGFPDFTDCATNTVEPLGDWMAVAHRGGPVRALDRRMPAFGDALSDEQIERVVEYLRTFCDDPAWPRGDLNLPRAFFTEKAFPENETVWTTGVSTSGTKAVSNELLYEHRLGSRWQYEVAVPFGMQQTASGGAWNRGLGDVELALRRTLYASLGRGSIVAAGAGVTLPTGKEELGLGNGFTIVEPFAMWGQLIGTNAFVQTHVGYEAVSDRTRGTNEAFVRTAFGYTVAQDRGFGRVWTPMLEVLTARAEGGATEWDVVPQAQVSLSKLQHVLLGVGARIPINAREERSSQFLTYVLWDWFDGGLFEFWK
jgi:mono/diheme cytochrome c family protein